MKTRVLLLFILISFNGFSQFSKTHYIPPLSNTDAYGTLDQYLYISSPSLVNINYRIIAIGGGITTGTVRRDNPQAIFIGNGSDTQILASGVKVNTILNNKGYIVEAEDLVYVTVRLSAALNNVGNPNHAGGLVSKGLAALGTQFRIGAFINTGVDSDSRHYTFASILATENNTVISFSDLKPGVSLINNAGAGNTPASITLNSGQSFIMAVQGPDLENKDGLIGALISSTKPVAVNCGSYGGTNGDTGNSSDIGFDQIVSVERTGKEYIFIKGNGVNVIERPLIVAHENNTEVFLNGSATPTTTLNAGQYIALDGSQFSASNNLYVKTSKNVFAYQGIGGSGSQANQNMHFLPPLSCETPKVIDNIPFINQIGGNNSFTGTVCIVTETAAVLNFIINGVSYTLAALSTAGITVNGPFAVTGNTSYETYTFEGFTGNVSVFSSKSVYLSYFGTSGAATYGGFYSGFAFKPEIAFNRINLTSSNCLGNTKLEVNSLTSFDTFDWYFDGILQTNPVPPNVYTPTMPGYYNVIASILNCGLPIESDKIPVSICPTDIDGDLSVDDIDIDNDNDGITNCTESYGNQDLNISNSATGVVAVGTYSNTFTGTFSNNLPLPIIGTPFIGNADGTFVTELPAGKQYKVVYNVQFPQPINIGLEYVGATANTSDLLNSNAEYIVNCDVDKTITVLNPSNQLLIDTNYDGIYESGVTKFSSFEIRFRINGTIPIAAGSGTFKFLSYQTNNFKITHRNLLDTAGNKSTFKLYAICVPKDTDTDGIPDQIDADSDNDGIFDVIEAQANASIAISNTDTNGNGLDNAFETGFIPVDTDLDLVLDYLDLDSDNDGIYDSNEGIADTDTDGIKNYRELDSDNDLCNDVIEAGFPGTPDSNGDGILGLIAPPTVNANGVVTSGSGYLVPNANYITSAPIVITTQPTLAPTCEFQNVTITSLVDNGGNTYQWQITTDGINWTNVTNNATYSGATLNALTITNVITAMNNYKYRVLLSKVGNSCGLLSADVQLKILALPIVNDVTIIQCDDDLDLLTSFNLTLKNDAILSPVIVTTETFTYYRTPAGANGAIAAQLISNFDAFPNTASPMNVWARIVNTDGCFRVAQITLIASASNIPQTYSFTQNPVCDDILDANGGNTGTAEINKRDGISAFNLSAGITAVQRQLPPPLSNYIFKYYRNEADALEQIDATTGISLEIPTAQLTNFRNDIPNAQDVWVRVNNVLGACSGFGPFIKLNVEKLPFANPVNEYRECDTDQDGIFNFNTPTLETSLLGSNQTFPVTVTYFDNATNSPLTDSNGVAITSPFPNSFSTTSKTIKAVVVNNTTQLCQDETLIKFTVDNLPEAFPVTNVILTKCDDETDPNAQDGILEFNTLNLESDVKGSQTNVEITYLDNLGNPLLDNLGNPVVSPFPATFITSSTTITAVVKNTVVGNNCPVAERPITFLVNPVPKINLVGDALVCTNNPSFTITLDAGINDGTPTTNYTYIWSLNGTPIVPAKTGYELTIFEAGIYTVQVSIPNPNPLIASCSRTRTITVVASNIATIEPTTIVDLTDNNTITINVSGPGDYVYSLDEEFGPFQESNIFTNVSSDIHIIYIKDLNGCGTVSETINVLGIPKYFTPNGDGFHDYWNVKGVSATFNSKTIIYIFDRFGKLIKQISPLDQGWNGTFNGTALPSTDYWYTIEFEDGRNVKGNFSLKR
ncbi:T9SS type B sorting domain-containing protein [Flavobacterium sp.]|uniref:T9SS type B sorting domain-containing protein n=1 Tax=Flavobacterium sp. TaxID=239 RepID=UPI00286DE932|nr:T9SS type B sorting domain-containing protein [Flavobacterium sp.]